MKKLTIFLFLAVFMMAGCNGTKASDNAMSDPGVNTLSDNVQLPMFLYYFDKDHMQVVYWTMTEEPENDNAHESWAMQETFRHHAKDYTKMLMDNNKVVDIKYNGEVLKNPDGGDIFPGELHCHKDIPGMGANYSLVNESDAVTPEFATMYVITTEEYMKTRKLLDIEKIGDIDFEEDNKTTLPDKVVKQLESEYDMKAISSNTAYKIGDRYTYGVVQFEPKDKKVLGLDVITDGEKVYSYPVEGFYDDEIGATWHVDDGGIYYASEIDAAFEGPDGLEIYFEHHSPESCDAGMLQLKDDKLEMIEYALYHAMMDEQIPLWKKDLAEMRRLYVEDDPEDKEYVFVKKNDVYIDDDNTPEIWLRSKDDKHGALFTRASGKIEMIGKETDRLHVTFLNIKDGIGYVKISGSAGGPSMWTEITGIKDNKIVERFNMLETYGDIVDCTLNGKAMTPQEAREYLSKLPEAKESWDYWQDLEE